MSYFLLHQNVNFPCLQEITQYHFLRVLQLTNGMRVLLISDPNISETEPDIESSKGVDNMAYSSAGEEDSEDEGEEEEVDEECEEEEGGSESETDEESEMDPDSTESNGVDSGLTRKSKQIKEGERMAAAALCVNIGSFSDPPDLPGLAHFLEHMVFMGSSKYPEENAFDEFLKVLKFLLIN